MNYQERYWVGVIRNIAFMESENTGDGYSKILNHCERLLEKSTITYPENYIGSETITRGAQID